VAGYENLIWRALSGTQVPLSMGNDRARRFAPAYPPMMGFAEGGNPDFQSLAAHCAPGDTFYVSEWRGAAPAGWTLVADGSMFAMAWRAPEPHIDEDLHVTRLGPSHAAQMVALAALVQPGPYANDPMAMGEWHGVIEDGQLVAMAGERLHVDALREVSGVCTLPDYRGRGYARGLMEIVIRSQLRRGLKPFLHVSTANVAARALYERMGFAKAHEAAMRVVRFDG